MLQTLSPIDLFRRRQVPPAPTPEPANELDKAVRTLKAVAAIGPELAKLDAEKAADDSLLEEIKARQLQRRERRLEIQRIQAESSRAESIVISLTSAEPDSEKRLTETGIAKSAEAAELAMRYHDFRANCEPVEATADYKQLQSILSDIADCEASIRRENDNPRSHSGLSAAEHRLRRLQAEQSEVQAKVERYRFGYQRWSEIQAAKAEANRLFGERDRLRAEREDAAIKAALKSK